MQWKTVETLSHLFRFFYQYTQCNNTSKYYFWTSQKVTSTVDGGEMCDRLHTPQFRHESSPQKLAFNFTDNNHIRPSPNKVTSMWDKYPVIQWVHFSGEPVREWYWTPPTDQTVVFCWHWPICFSPQMFGCGAVAQLVLIGGSHGMFLTVNFSFGFAATLGILVCGQVSGKPRNCQAQTISDTYLYLTKQC